MIRYNLVCDRRHEFESWFADSSAYDKQAKRGLVECPVCGSAKVEKALMTPRLAGTRKRSVAAEPARDVAPAAAEPNLPVPASPVAMMSPTEQEFRRKLRELRDYLVSHADNVGTRFPEEARKMHYGEAEHRSIYGIATPEEASDLHEEGIEFAALPVLPDERN